MKEGVRERGRENRVCCKGDVTGRLDELAKRIGFKITIWLVLNPGNADESPKDQERDAPELLLLLQGDAALAVKVLTFS